MDYRRHLLVFICILFLFPPALSAVELPTPAELLKQMGVTGKPVTVVEPHQSDPLHTTNATYLAVPASQVLDHLFGRRWRSPDSDVVFFATDEYQYAGGFKQFEQYNAYLAFARADGESFALENCGRSPTALGPYYLIWDNIKDPALIKQDGYGWPYQVTRVDLRPVSDYDPLLPVNPSQQARDGFILFKEYCLNCHQIASIGGRKWPADLRQSLCPLTDSELKALINYPNCDLRNGGMPDLNGWLQGEERKQTIDLIVAYLRAMQAEGQSCQSENVRPTSEK
jgi:hypothetical protein